MIWHIFKKDWKLLWPSAAVLAALHFILNAARLSQGRFVQARLALVASDASYLPGRGLLLVSILPYLALLGSAFLIVAIVQQDAIPGLRQDWLVRPIRRRDLLLAKLVAVLVMVQLPMFAADLAEALAWGFPLAQSMGAASERSAHLLLILCVPVFAFAALTKNVMEAIAGGVAVVLGVAVLSTLTVNPMGTYVNSQALDWLDYSMRGGILVAGAAALLAVQYFRRKTTLSRWLLVAVGLLYWLTPTVPWQAAFALGERLSPTPGAGNPVTIGLAPKGEPLTERPAGPVFYKTPGNIFVLLPVLATGQPDQSILLADYTSAKLFTKSGEVHNLGNQMGFQIWRERPGEGEKPITYGIRVPAAVYQRIADEPVRVEIDYFLTLMGQSDSQTLRAAGGDQRTRRLGWCGTRGGEDGLQVLYGCIQTGDAGACASVVLEHPPTGARNPRIGLCRPEYAPFRTRYERDDALGRFVVALNFTDPSVADDTAVKPAMLGEATVTARAYEARDHFVRHVVIPEIRLREWATE